MLNPQHDEETRAVQSGPEAPLAMVCLGEVPWDQSWKRNQSMVYELSRRPLIERVAFVNPREIWVRKELLTGNGSLPRRIRRVWNARPRKFDSQIGVCNMVRFMPMRENLGLIRRMERNILRAHIRRLTGNQPFILLNNHPVFFSKSLLQGLMDEAVLTVFDLSDDFVEFFGDQETRDLCEEYTHHCCEHSDVVFAVNEHVKEKYAATHPDAHVVLNSTNFDNFNRTEYRPVPYLEELVQPGRLMLGHTGVISRVRIDYELLSAMARMRPDWDFVFVGSSDASFRTLVDAHPNLHFFDTVHYDALPDHIAYFDVTFIPFQVNEHTRGNDLLKFQDYMAMGKPIVTTNTAGAWRYGDLLRIVEGTEEFVAGIEAAHREDSEDLRQRRREFAESHSWARRAPGLESILRNALESRGVK